MQIDIDFDVFKALTAKRMSETDTYNAVLRRLLALPDQGAVEAEKPSALLNGADWAARGSPPRNAAEAAAWGREWDAARNAVIPEGAWFDNKFFPNGTRFRVTYKGQLFTAEIREGRWIGSDGVVRTSPSAAAGAISNTNVNGWRFWYALCPGASEWRRLDSFKS